MVEIRNTFRLISYWKRLSLYIPFVLEYIAMKDTETLRFTLKEVASMLKMIPFGKLVFKLILLPAALLFAAGSANAEVYSLGDSLSDAGSLGFTYTNPATLTPLTRGKVWVQYLSSNSTPAFCNDPKHCLFNNDTFYYTGTGNNYAVGGAGVAFDSADAQVNKSYTNLHSQIHALLHNHVLDKKDVITVWMGANDIIAATSNLNKSVSQVTYAAQVFTTEISNLTKTGARIYVFTIPDLGRTPFGQTASDGGTLLSYLTNLFNSSISTLKNVNLIYSNEMFNTLYDQWPTPMIYCSVIIDPKHLCGDPKINPINQDPTIPPTLLFADPEHPSNAAHQYIGNLLWAKIQ